MIVISSEDSMGGGRRQVDGQVKLCASGVLIDVTGAGEWGAMRLAVLDKSVSLDVGARPGPLVLVLASGK